MSKGAPKTINKILFSLVLAVSLTLLPVHFVHSQSISDLEREVEEKNKQINEKKGTLSEIEKRIAEIRGSNNSLAEKISLMSAELDKVQEGIKKAEEESESKLREIEQKQKDLEEKKEFIDEISHELYIETRNSTPAFFLLGEGWDKFMRGFFIKTSAISSLRHEIEEISGDFLSLADARAELEKEKEDLDIQKKDLDSSFALLDEERAKLQAELREQNARKNAVKAQIGGLAKEISETQQKLLYIKGGGNLSGTNIPSSNAERTAQLSYFMETAPKGTFGIFSFGASTHRNGMSQWGAWERAQNGQTYQQILEFYYKANNGVIGETNFVNTGSYGREAITSTIQVVGYSERIDLEAYVLGVREIDPLFNKNTAQDMNNLKAQAIASRTYAVNYTNNGRKAICATQACQVYNPSNAYSGAWAQAVAETRGMTLKNSETGNIFSTQFSAVTGGYINGVGYDLNTSLGGGWAEKAWEGLAGVSWFHKIWFQQNKVACSTHPNPWMTGEELADILNAYKYYQATKTEARLDSRFTSIDTKACFGDSVIPYSWNDLANFVDNPIAKVLSAEAINNNGWTTGLNFTVQLRSGAITTYSIIGSTSPNSNTAVFRDVFNLRAPGYLSIPQKCSGCPGFIHINIVQK